MKPGGGTLEWAPCGKMGAPGIAAPVSKPVERKKGFYWKFQLNNFNTEKV